MRWLNIRFIVAVLLLGRKHEIIRTIYKESKGFNKSNLKDFLLFLWRTLSNNNELTTLEPNSFNYVDFANLSLM